MLKPLRFDGDALAKEFRVQGSGFAVRFRVWGLGFRFLGLGAPYQGNPRPRTL